MKQITIREAVVPDALNIGAVGMCVWVDTYATEGVYEDIARFVHSEFTEEKIKELISLKKVHVATQEEKIVGYIVLDEEVDSKYEIVNLYILPKFQNQGIGEKFLWTVRKTVDKPIWLSTWELNHNAIAFYQKHGFKEVGELYFDLYGAKIRNVVLEFSPDIA